MIEVLFFSGNNCSVCKALLPKVEEALEEQKFQGLNLRVIKVEKEPVIAAQHLVFTLPVVIIKKDHVEVKRFVRSFGVGELVGYIQRVISPTV
jgi:thiol-disulfide isomerase/thioredoxin